MDKRRNTIPDFIGGIFKIKDRGIKPNKKPFQL